jgi:pyruvate kinase
MGPAVRGEEKIAALIESGMDGARLNFSHGTHDDHKQFITQLKAVRSKKGVPLAIILDTKGPEIRLGTVEPPLSLKTGDRITLVKEASKGGIQITPPFVIDALEVGVQLLIDDGYLTTRVVEKHPHSVVVEALNAGVIKTHKGVNVPGVDIELPAMTEQDVQDIAFGVDHGVDIIAASFIRSKEHIVAIKTLLKKLGGSHIPVYAKIENSLGVSNFDAILQASDGIMVARGDLGVELPLKEVPPLQKMMIRKCYLEGKPVITATQMLESMIKHPRPTRAEVSDVANAVYDSTSAIMLSGETAAGDYPIQAVQMMRSIAETAENNFDYHEFFTLHHKADFRDISSSIALAAVHTAYNTHAKGIFCFTQSGSTARHLSRFRPEMPLIVLASDARVYHQMALVWGVVTVPPVQVNNVHEAFEIVSAFALKHKILNKGDLVVVTAGEPFNQMGSTNMMLVERVR